MTKFEIIEDDEDPTFLDADDIKHELVLEEWVLYAV